MKGLCASPPCLFLGDKKISELASEHLKLYRSLSKCDGVQQHNKDETLQIDVRDESNRSKALKYLNFSAKNKQTFQKLQGLIHFQDLLFVPVRGKKGLCASPPCLFLGEKRISELAFEHLKTGRRLINRARKQNNSTRSKQIRVQGSISASNKRSFTNISQLPRGRKRRKTSNNDMQEY